MHLISHYTLKDLLMWIHFYVIGWVDIVYYFIYNVTKPHINVTTIGRVNNFSSCTNTLGIMKFFYAL